MTIIIIIIIIIIINDEYYCVILNINIQTIIIILKTMNIIIVWILIFNEY